jgi:hypothetical protein
MATEYVARIVDGLLDEMLASFSAVSLVGPRAADDGLPITSSR